MPEIGRFISEDPWSGTMAIPTTMNPYPYVLNNPIKYVDPLGLWPSVSPSGEVQDDPYTRKYLNNSQVNKVNNKVQQNETKNGSDAFYGNLKGTGEAISKTIYQNFRLRIKF